MNDDSDLDPVEYWKRRLQQMRDSAGQLPIINRKEDKFEHLRDKTAIQLGMGGYCYLASELLLDLFPTAQIWRLSEPDRNTFGHVFLMVNGYAVDIAGLRSVDDLLATAEFAGCIAEQTSVNAVRSYVRRVIDYEEEEKRTVHEVLSSYIKAHRDEFRRIPDASNTSQASTE
jgi:hypothetical protein